ncbi:MAG: alkaline phosphatase family protein [Arenibacter sp.]|nr:alkaline phosphatase family protein [Arenibacter sp.]
MTKKTFILGLVLILSTLVLSSCKTGANVLGTTPTTNSKKSLAKPYLILISLDGFRWDYMERFNPPNMSGFIQEGVKAVSLVPSFPSKTFPNHYTIATGMYPDKHGILANSFYSNAKDLIYSIRNREMVEDGSFYGGAPIWVQADKAAMVSASYFFVGSEADIMGIRPTYYHRYDGKIKNDDRVAEVLKWLALPEKERPHMITMYFSDMDDVGHRFGPNNDEVLKKTVFNLDRSLGDLFNGVDATGLPVNIIIVSDHGMAEQSAANLIPIEDIKNDNLYSTIDNGAIVNIHPKKGVHIDSIFRYLKTKEKHFSVYKTKNTPGFEYSPENKDWGAIQLIPDYSYYFLSSRGIEARKKNPNTLFGVHGYDPKYKEMHGIFYANGPAFKKGYEVSSVKNIHIYPLMCKILGLKIPNNIDGKLSEIENVLN